MHEGITIHEAYKRAICRRSRLCSASRRTFRTGRGPAGGGELILEYAIYHSPLPFIRALLELGADPNYQDHAGFPSLIAALSADRGDRYQLIELLLAHGADIQKHGINDGTPLHYAAATDDLEGIEILLAHGAEPTARTRIDDYATPLEEAEILGRTVAVKALRKLTAG